MTVTIAMVSGKGGTGKTTTAINLACALAEQHFSVLAVDMDPQANLTSGLGFNPYHLTDTIFQVLTGESADGAPLLRTEYGIDLLPCSPELSSVESALPSRIGKEFLLRGSLEDLTKYDFVLIDTPPSFGFHTMNALAAADYLLVPVQMSGFALNGLNEVQRTMAAARQELNPQLRVLGVLPTFVAPRTNFSHDMMAALRALPDLRVFQTQVCSTVKFAETSLEGVPILTYASASKAANAYRSLALEVMERVEMPVREQGAATPVPTWVKPLIPEPLPIPTTVTASAPISATIATEPHSSRPAPVSRPTTGALSVDAAALLGMIPPDPGSNARPIAHPSSTSLPYPTHSLRTLSPAVRLITQIRTLARRLTTAGPA